jgi:hypothetical protein
MSKFTVKVKAGLKREKPEQPEKELLQPPSRIARQLALAHLVERMVDEGKIRNYAEAARRLGVTRARMSQILNLLTLPHAVQERILLGREHLSERRLRGGGPDSGSSSRPLLTAAAARSKP